jgi:hypothetical protein
VHSNLYMLLPVEDWNDSAGLCHKKVQRPVSKNVTVEATPSGNLCSEYYTTFVVKNKKEITRVFSWQILIAFLS